MRGLFQTLNNALKYWLGLTPQVEAFFEVRQLLSFSKMFLNNLEGAPSFEECSLYLEHTVDFF